MKPLFLLALTALTAHAEVPAEIHARRVRESIGIIANSEISALAHAEARAQHWTCSPFSTATVMFDAATPGDGPEWFGFGVNCRSEDQQSAEVIRFHGLVNLVGDADGVFVDLRDISIFKDLDRGTPGAD